MVYKSYACFINEKEKIWKGLPNRERHILESVLIHGFDTQQRVTDLLKLKDIGSQATLHAALMRLKRAHFLILTTDTRDGRVKFVSLAPKALTIFKSLAALMYICTKPITKLAVKDIALKH